MKITLDTNVILSSTFWFGDSSKIMEMVEKGETELILSEDIIEEYKDVLNYEEFQDKIKNKNLEMQRTVEEIITLSKIVEPKNKFDVIKEDSDDNKIIECAVEGKVDYIISQDKHLLDIKEFQGIKIITPKDFLIKKNYRDKIENQKFITSNKFIKP